MIGNMDVPHGPRQVAGVVFNLQRFSLHDGPGIRTTVFLKGCPLHCSWCHNPEGLAAAPEVLVRHDRCLECGRCLAVCPRDTGPLPAGAILGADGCHACRACVTACPGEARQVVGREWTVDEVLTRVLRDRPFYDQSGGGVTFSGGEPLAQPDFLLACLERCRSEGIRSAVDTSGAATLETLLAAARRADLLLFDLKVMAPELHRSEVGIPAETIRTNLRAVAELARPVWLRLPLVPGISDEPERLRDAVRLAAELGCVERVCLLPYHRTGTGKLDRLGRPGSDTITPPAPDRIAALAAAIAVPGVRIQIGG
jgi:pyruvate formate lyase activating enzyme